VAVAFQAEGLRAAGQVVAVALVEVKFRPSKWRPHRRAVLKVAAAGLTFVVLYVLCYALADHYLHIGAAGRVAALVILAAGVIALLALLAPIIALAVLVWLGYRLLRRRRQAAVHPQ